MGQTKQMKWLLLQVICAVVFKASAGEVNNKVGLSDTIAFPHDPESQELDQNEAIQRTNAKTISSSEERQPQYNLNDLMNQCPYADICTRKGRDKSSMAEGSCCLSCSCESNCKFIGNCCDKREAENYMCHFPYVPREDVYRPIYSYGSHLEYFLVDRCPSNATLRDCKEEAAGPWGSLYPVYDPSSDLNFYNHHCAHCNGVQTYIYWDLKLECGYAHDEVQRIYESILLENRDEYCDIGFIPPRVIDMEKHVCSTRLISSCNMSGIWKLYDVKLEQACHTWFSPYLDMFGALRYSNVFCALCNGEVLGQSESMCISLYASRANEYQDSFAMTIDYRKVSAVINNPSTYISERTKNGNCGKNMVKHPTKIECREVLCPNGFIRGDRTCEPISTEWLHNLYYIQLEMTLSSDENLPFDYLDLSAKQQTRLKTWFNSQGAPLDYFVMFAQIGNDFNISKVIVRVGRMAFPINIAKETNSIMNAMNKQWTITLRGKLFSFSVKIDRYASYVPDGNVRYDLIRYLKEGVLDYEAEPPKPMYSFLFLKEPLSDALVLKKTNFCERVRLLRSEWIGGFQEILLNVSYGSSNAEKRLGDSEFNIHLDQLGEPVVDICVEDFNPDYRPEEGPESRAVYPSLWECYFLIMLQLVITLNFL